MAYRPEERHPRRDGDAAGRRRTASPEQGVDVQLRRVGMHDDGEEERVDQAEEEGNSGRVSGLQSTRAQWRVRQFWSPWLTFESLLHIRTTAGSNPLTLFFAVQLLILLQPGCRRRRCRCRNAIRAPKRYDRAHDRPPGRKRLLSSRAVAQSVPETDVCTQAGRVRFARASERGVLRQYVIETRLAARRQRIEACNRRDEKILPRQRRHRVSAKPAEWGAFTLPSHAILPYGCASRPNYELYNQPERLCYIQCREKAPRTYVLVHMDYCRVFG